MTEQITAARVLEALEAVVAEKGEDYVYDKITNQNGYDTCYYVCDGGPSCIAGHALHRLGVPLEVLTQFEGTTPSGLAEQNAFAADEAALAALDEAQVKQDRGDSWGEALEAAREAAEREAATDA